jgi:brefeldin A-inhibited guanine nucleotide-exchange protein
MTKAEFAKNNRGINDNSDLPEEFLAGIYDEIVNNEIRMKDELEAPLPAIPSGPGLANALANVGRDLQREAYVMQSNGMAVKTEVNSNFTVDERYNNSVTGTFSHSHAFSTKRNKAGRSIL